MNEIPFEDTPPVDIIIHNGLGITCPNGSMIEVWQIQGDDGLHITLKRKLDDDTYSRLKFGISREAAIVLCGLLQTQLYPELREEITVKP